MDPGKDGLLGRFKWHIIIVCIVVGAVLLLSFRTNPSQTSESVSLIQLGTLVGILSILLGILTALPKLFKLLGTAQENGEKLEKIAEALEKSRTILTQINQSARLSETAKAIAFRDADRQTLREAVFDKLQQQDFNTAYEMIDEVAHRDQYKALAEQLKLQANRFRDATDQERINQVIEHVEKLFENYDWAKASVHVERLIKAYPKAEKAKAMRQKLVDKKDDRKKALLTTWDDAVKREDTDRSLEILRELDLYLTPNEGLALQEAARDVFRNKLHNLGVQFSLSVSEKQWANALKTGQQIMRDFPNSRMAEEIRDNWDILKQKAEQNAR